MIFVIKVLKWYRIFFSVLEFFLFFVFRSCLVKFIYFNKVLLRKCVLLLRLLFVLKIWKEINDKENVILNYNLN